MLTVGTFPAVSQEKKKYDKKFISALKKENIKHKIMLTPQQGNKIQGKHYTSMYLPPSFSWHRKLEKISSTADNRTSLPWCHWNVKRAYPYDPFLVSKNGQLCVYLYSAQTS